MNKGDKLFGGSFSFATYNCASDVFNSSGGNNAGIAPSFSWVIKKNLSFGTRAVIGYSQSKASNSSTPETKNKNFGLGLSLFLKKYKLLQNKFGFYIDNEINVNYTINKQESGSPVIITKFKNKGIGYRLNPGVFYRFSNHFFGEANIGGAYFSYNKGQDAHSFSGGLSFLQYFNLGINYQLDKKKS